MAAVSKWKIEYFLLGGVALGGLAYMQRWPPFDGPIGDQIDELLATAGLDLRGTGLVGGEAETPDSSNRPCYRKRNSSSNYNSCSR